MLAEIRWLPNSLLKDIKYPTVEYEIGEFGGYFTRGTNILTINPDQLYIESIIAHEFCHYLQDINGYNNPASNWALYQNKYGYEVGIKRYFVEQNFEMEALKFEYKYSPNEINEWWINKLVKE